MKIRSIRHYINEAFIGLLRNRLMSFASIMTVASCIFMLSISFCIASNLDGILKQVEGTVGLTVYIERDLSAEKVNELFSKVKTLDNVKNVKYISAEDALNSFKDDLGEDNQLPAGLEKDNPLPRSFNIDINEASKQDELVKELEKLIPEGIAQIRHQKYIVDVLSAINNGVRIVSIITIIILVIVSVVIITNTIRIAVNNRRVEINIMKYVGATDWFIRWPFIIEGMLIGLIGSALPLGLCMVGYNKILSLFYEKMPMIENIVVFKPGIDIFSTLVPITLILGTSIGTFGSVTSIRKHLKV